VVFGIGIAPAGDNNRAGNDPRTAKHACRNRRDEKQRRGGKYHDGAAVSGNQHPNDRHALCLHQQRNRGHEIQHGAKHCGKHNNHDHNRKRKRNPGGSGGSGNPTGRGRQLCG